MRTGSEIFSRECCDVWWGNVAFIVFLKYEAYFPKALKLSQLNFVTGKTSELTLTTRNLL